MANTAACQISCQTSDLHIETQRLMVFRSAPVYSNGDIVFICLREKFDDNNNNNNNKSYHVEMIINITAFVTCRSDNLRRRWTASCSGW